MLALNTEVHRKVVLCLVVPLLLSALIVAFATFGAATLEFRYAVSMREAACLPAITEFYRNTFRWVWALPIGVAVWGGYLLRKQSCFLGGLVFFAGTYLFVMTAWVALSALSFYLGNQSFFAGRQ